MPHAYSRKIKNDVAYFCFLCFGRLSNTEGAIILDRKPKDFLDLEPQCKVTIIADTDHRVVEFPNVAILTTTGEYEIRL